MKENVIENKHRNGLAFVNLTNLFAFYNATTRFVDMRRAMNIINFHIGKFSTLCPTNVSVRMLYSEWMDN